MAKKSKKITKTKSQPSKKAKKSKLGAKKTSVKKSAPQRFGAAVFASSPVIKKEGAKIRVLVGKAGLDGHDRGAKIIARACRDAGFEVVYTGLHQTPDMIVNTAIQEDVDVLGLSILSGAHNYLVPEVIKLLKAQGVTVGKDMLLVVGGIIPESDFAPLKKSGVSMVFTPGTSVDSIVEYIKGHVQSKS